MKPWQLSHCSRMLLPANSLESTQCQAMYALGLRRRVKTINNNLCSYFWISIRLNRKTKLSFLFVAANRPNRRTSLLHDFYFISRIQRKLYCSWSNRPSLQSPNINKRLKNESRKQKHKRKEKRKEGEKKEERKRVLYWQRGWSVFHASC